VRRWPINIRRVAVFIGMLVLILMVMDFNARLETLNLLRRQEAIVSTQLYLGCKQLALQTRSLCQSDQGHNGPQLAGTIFRMAINPVPAEVPGDASGS
jgi:hypothetical protein